MSKIPGGWRGIHLRNWSLGPSAMHEPAVELSAWDKLLNDLQISEAQALELLAERKGPEVKRITQFVRCNKDRLFVPLQVLDRLGEAMW